MTEQVTFQLRRGNSTGATGWSTINPILAQGEPGFELDTTTLKIGDGSENWNNLNTLKFGQQIAIGYGAGNTGQKSYAIAIGAASGTFSQGYEAIAIGINSGQNNQGTNSIALGPQAGQNNQGTNSIAIGNLAGCDSNSITFQAANTIILNASGQDLVGISGQTGSFYVAPIRSGNIGSPLVYDTLTKEITYNTVTSTIGITGSSGIGVTFDGTTYTISSTGFSVPINSVLVSPNGTGISGTTGFQYSIDGITLNKINIQSDPGSNTISIGNSAGKNGQGLFSIAIGQDSGNRQGDNSVSIGYGAGQTQQEQFTVAIGNSAGITGQKERAVAIGQSAGNTEQGKNCVAIGDSAGYAGQKQYSVAIGPSAGQTNQGDFSIAIGNNAAVNDQPPNSICLNANSAILDPTYPNSFNVAPIRKIISATLPVGFYNLAYNPVTSEIIYWSLS